jgi:glycosyltransferase involved in cell wall biosynthesis
LDAVGQKLNRRNLALVRPRLRYIGKTMSFAEMARLYQAADVLVAPYTGEGFNLPVLEAVACGLPVICTGGRPTDDFTREEFAMRIDSKVEPLPDMPGYRLKPDLEHLIALMRKSVKDEAFAKRARKAGPKHVSENYTWRHVTGKLVQVLAPSAGPGQ